jgi:hypothetical protein
VSKSPPCIGGNVRRVDSPGLCSARPALSFASKKEGEKTPLPFLYAPFLTISNQFFALITLSEIIALHSNPIKMSK